MGRHHRARALSGGAGGRGARGALRGGLRGPGSGSRPRPRGVDRRPDRMGGAASGKPADVREAGSGARGANQDGARPPSGGADRVQPPSRAGAANDHARAAAATAGAPRGAARGSPPREPADRRPGRLSLPPPGDHRVGRARDQLRPAPSRAGPSFLRLPPPITQSRPIAGVRPRSVVAGGYDAAAIAVRSFAPAANRYSLIRSSPPRSWTS